jgi:hypothetical protein
VVTSALSPELSTTSGLDKPSSRVPLANVLSMFCPCLRDCLQRIVKKSNSVRRSSGSSSASELR